MSIEIKLSFSRLVIEKTGGDKGAEVGKMSSLGDTCILAVMVKARGKILECDQSFILADR